MLNKIEVEVLGRPRLFRFDMFAMELLYDNDEIIFPGKLGFVTKMLYAGLASGCNDKGIENDFTRSDVLDILDELSTTEKGRQTLTKLSECLMSSTAYKSMLETDAAMRGNGEDQEKKTQLTGTASAPMLSEK